MKKLIVFLCLLSLCLPLFGCASSLEAEETLAATETKEVVTEEEKEEGPITYPDSFSVGFSRVDITGTPPLPIYNTVATSVHDPLLMTCTAIWDGENVALLYSLDSWFIADDTTKTAMGRLEKEFGIPASAIMFNSTHSHSAPLIGGESDMILRYLTMFYKQVLVAAEEALRDLDPVTATFTGKSHTDGITFVRRYLMGDGSYRGIGSNNPNDEFVAHETEADNEMRTIRFERENKKDVLMINYQTHYGGATSLYPDQLSADFVTPYRDRAEKEFDCNFVYHSGASGNINFISNIPGERKYPTYLEAIDEFMAATKAALDAEEEANVGPIRHQRTDYVATVNHDPEDVVAKAVEVKALPEAEQGSKTAEYGFESILEVNAIVTRSRYGETNPIPLSVITFGDFAFAAFPYEMFDQSGIQVRQGSPFKTTFICSLTNGSHGYLPTAEAFPNGCYEVYVTRYVQGTAEALVAESLKMLQACK